MSRALKLIVYAAIVEMALVALGVFAWRHGALPWLPAPVAAEPPRSMFMLAYGPTVFAIACVYAGRRLASHRPRISDTHRRYLEGSIKVAAAFIATLQGYFAWLNVTGSAVNPETLARALVVFGGLWMTFQGNAAATLIEPSR